MGKNLHSKAFDEGTKIKLDLYSAYLKEWLPVFLAREPAIYKTINVFDFFCGPGKDIDGNSGSPILAIDSLFNYLPEVVRKKLAVNLYFNEFSKSKLEELEKTLNAMDLANKPFKIELSRLTFKDAFENLFPLMTKSVTANFLFLDQNGIKEITPNVFRKILNLQSTDFMFFISSSTLSRFCEHEEIKKYIDIPKTTLTSANYYHIHREIINFYKTLVPPGTKWFLAPFSIKKGSNIYGLIFGSRHVLGIEKFLRKCWDIDEDRGEANFDIDDDNLEKAQVNLFSEYSKPKKMVVFENDLKRGILEQSLKTNKDVYLFTLENGFLPNHSREVVKAMIKTGEILTPKLPITYDSYKEAEAIEIRIK